MPETTPLPRPSERTCRCPEHSEYLLADVDGWHCEICKGRVPRDATNHPEVTLHLQGSPGQIVDLVALELRRRERMKRRGGR